MAYLPKDYSIHLLGLGGTGANIVETFLKSKQIYELLKRPGVKLTCLALDVADHDVASLHRAYNEFREKLKALGLPPDRVGVDAKSVKFPTPEAMFEFIEKYPDYLEREGAAIPPHYRPWLSSSIEIPPLSGGVGRRRALSKGIYGLNYYYLGLINNLLDGFKESVSTSTIQPVIIVVFGVGGGSGSGMAVDFARHLRRKLGSGFPIIGLGILPCSGDDPPAKGASALASLCELELLLDRDKNAKIKQQFSAVYENPWTGFITMPLGPAYSKAGSMVDARKFIDEAIVDVLVNVMRFDLSDLLNNIGASLDLGEHWVHTLSTLGITYPINEHIALIKLQLEKLDQLRAARKEKVELISSLGKLVDASYAELSAVYKMVLIRRGYYEEQKFEKALRDYIYEDKSLELNLNMRIKGIEDAVRAQATELSTPLIAVGLEAVEGTFEARIRSLVSEVTEGLQEIAKIHAGFHELAERIRDDVESSIAGAQKLTVKQKLLVADVIDLVQLIDRLLLVFRKLVEAKTFGDRLVKELSKEEKTEEYGALMARVQRLLNPDISGLLSIVPSIVQPPNVELKVLDGNLSNIRVIRRALKEQEEGLKATEEGALTQAKKIENERDRLLKELRAIKLGFLSSRKQFLEQKIKELEQQIKVKKLEAETVTEELGRVQTRVTEYQALERKFGINTEYRKTLSSILNLSTAFYEKLSEVSRDKGYYERTADITEQERLRIMQKILKEEEDQLTRENILREIIDKAHLREYLVGTLKVFQLPSSLGVTADFRTDYMWVTVVAPRGIWNQDLSSDLKAILAGYIKGDASRCITIREVDSPDPWTIRFLVIAAKSSLADLDMFSEMKSLYDQSPRGDRLLAHSFLLEYGVIANLSYVNDILAPPSEKGLEKAPETRGP